MLANHGQEAEAIAVLSQHTREHPDAHDARRMLIRLYGSARRLDRAEAEAEQLAERLGAASPIPWIELGHAFELARRYPEALALYDRAARVAPTDPSGPREGGLRAARWGEAELAAARLEEALRRDPADAEVWHALGLALVHLGDFAGARTAYERGLIADPRALENHLGLASLALKQERPAQALTHYDRVLMHKPEFSAGHLGRSWALILLGRLDEAMEAIARAEKLGGHAKIVANQRRVIRSLTELSESPRQGQKTKQIQ